MGRFFYPIVYIVQQELLLPLSMSRIIWKNKFRRERKKFPWKNQISRVVQKTDKQRTYLVQMLKVQLWMAEFQTEGEFLLRWFKKPNQGIAHEHSKGRERVLALTLLSRWRYFQIHKRGEATTERKLQPNVFFCFSNWDLNCFSTCVHCWRNVFVCYQKENPQIWLLLKVKSLRQN